MFRYSPGSVGWLPLKHAHALLRSRPGHRLWKQRAAGIEFGRRAYGQEGARDRPVDIPPEYILLSFKKGAFYLAVQAGVSIVLMVCETY